MSARVCYIQREDRGAVLRRLRVIGAKADDAWEPPTEDPAALGRTVSSAAAWIADRLSAKPGGRLGGRVLDRLCLDPDGGVCGWITANAADTRMVRAVIEQEAAGDSDDPFTDASAHAGRFPDLPGEVNYQPLAAGRAVETGPSRTPVLAVPDIAARSLIDALDEQGVQVGSCVTIWQAMIAAWAHTSASTPQSERVVAESSPVFAVVLCVPGERVIWAWGRGSSTIAAGAFRTRLGVRPTPGLLLEEPPEVRGTNGHAAPNGAAAALGGRLATEWLAWSAQIGHVPSRVLWVSPVGTTPHNGSGAGVGLDSSEIARALSRAAPRASFDAIDDPDPVGLTLRRLAENLDEGGPGHASGADAQLVTLSNRPGRAHRGMYRWLAILLLAASAAIGTFAWTFWQQRGEAINALANVRANQLALLEAGAPELVNDRLAVVNLRSMVNEATGPAPVQIPPQKPVLRELETLAFVLGNPDYEVQEIDIGAISVSFRVLVDGTVAYEQLEQSLFGIAGSSVLWSTPLTTRPSGEKIAVTGTGVWDLPQNNPSQSSAAPIGGRP